MKYGYIPTRSECPVTPLGLLLPWIWRAIKCPKAKAARTKGNR